MNTGLVNQQLSFNQTGNSLWEYLLVVHPDDNVNEKVNVEKNYFYNEYGQKIAIKTKPHITLANFLAKEAMEDTLIRWIQRVCDHHARFETALNNFSGFPPHTIYLRVQNPHPYKTLVQNLKVIESFIQSNGCPPARLISSPHMTIARHLPPEVYEEAIKEYASRSFHETFSVNHLALIKRKSKYEKCIPVNIFPLASPHNNLFN
jgi:2'-5' RNA ligase